MRKLASIKIISELHPIKNKDRIELAIIDGWQVIVRKGEYNIGDKTVFIEIDSVLPNKPEFEFLSSEKYRIKTMKLSGVLSQGICFPLSILPQSTEYDIGDDVTDIIGVKKYESNTNNKEMRETQNNKKFQQAIFKFLFRYKIFRDLFLSKKENKGFPNFISKTDEVRCQNIPHILKNKDIKYIVREKIDGSSITVFLKKNKKRWYQKQTFDFGVCSRNLRIWKEDDGNYWAIVKKYNLQNVLKGLIGNNDFVAIQGEVIAHDIQNNKYKVKDVDLFVFNFIYPNGRIECLEGERILKRYGLKWCPLIKINYILPDTINELLNYSTDKSALSDTLREGIVLRNYEKNISFKVVSPEFLIIYDE